MMSIFLPVYKFLAPSHTGMLTLIQWTHTGIRKGNILAPLPSRTHMQQLESKQVRA